MSNRVLDLRGERCPVIFQRIMLALEGGRPGDVWEVWFNYPPAVAGVPRSLEVYRHQVLSLEAMSPTAWRLMVRAGERGIPTPLLPGDGHGRMKSWHTTMPPRGLGTTPRPT